MIKDKFPQDKTENNKAAGQNVAVPEIVSENAFVNMYRAVKRAILTIRENEDNPLSGPYFKTIAITRAKKMVSS